jgi:hypothetical protein
MRKDGFLIGAGDPGLSRRTRYVSVATNTKRRLKGRPDVMRVFRSLRRPFSVAVTDWRQRRMHLDHSATASQRYRATR